MIGNKLIVLQVVRSYPNCVLPKELKTPAEKEVWWSKEWDEKRDLLHRARFYRVGKDQSPLNTQIHNFC